jgi:hypothetical protein
MFDGLTYNSVDGERRVLIDGYQFTESRLREALKWIEAQPKHNWKPGDVFIYRSGDGGLMEGSIYKIMSLQGPGAANAVRLWNACKNKVGEKDSFTWWLPDSYMVKLMEIPKG